MTTKYSILTANEAVARMAYKTNQVFPIYPITPSSEMSALVEQWSAENVATILGNVPSVFQMQSEAGVAGTMHGALQTGALSSTFTSSQGLLLMLPNMYKIAGELTPNVIHVATRSIATHALSVFGDHSDIMACRQSGYAFLGSASVQEAQDFALIAQAASLASRIPFVHFFDGFRTSHEVNKIASLTDSDIKKLIDVELINQHQNRALSPNNPIIRGTSQGPDVFFQSREAINSFYNMCPDIVQEHMNVFSKLTGRRYKLFDYVGHPKAEHIIVSMASSTETVETTINQLNKQGHKFGLIKVRLFRPFSTKHLLETLPNTVKSVAVLDRTKEPGSTGEPLYLDIVQSITEAFQNNKISNLPKIIGGRYGLSSKEFTPSMVNTIFTHLKKDTLKNNFTIGITDDVTHLSLDNVTDFNLNSSVYQAIFHQYKSNDASAKIERLAKHIGNNNELFVQGFTECDYRKSKSCTVAHLRISHRTIKAPYHIKHANFVACENVDFLKLGSVLDTIKTKGTLLINSSLSSKAFWQSLSANKQYQIIEKEVQLYIINLNEIRMREAHKTNDISNLFESFLALQTEFSYSNTALDLSEYIYKVDTTDYSKENIKLEDYDLFSETLLGKLLANKGNDIPVSQLPVDGSYSSNTSQYNAALKSDKLPIWNENMCTQCGACSMACPQGSLRLKVYNDNYLKNASKAFKHIDSEAFDLLNYTIQNNPDQCNGCNNCVDACPSKALQMVNRDQVNSAEKKNWNYFKTIPEVDREKIDTTKVSQQQLQEPLFKYSHGVEGCGEAPYLKLVSQLFGNRLIVANATGASSIFGGALPTTPWSKNNKGQGPAWSNSLFEDNAEFGLGFRLSLDMQEQQAKLLLENLLPQLDFDLAYDILKAKQTTEVEIQEQTKRVEQLKEILKGIDSEAASKLQRISDALIKKSVWIIGGDGWAYDIGYGGIDHVLATGKNVNILVLDNEVYDNTGGQASKATPFGATAKFSFNSKQKQKKDLGKLAMTYTNVYVASIAIGANKEQTLKAFNEAESFNGPSIIIAYTHSASQGINMSEPSKYHKAAVNSGQWILYRNDPRKEHSFQLDSLVPTLKIEEYLKMENRFSKLFDQNDSVLKPALKGIQNNVNRRFNYFLNLADNNSLSRTQMTQRQKTKKSLGLTE